MIRYFLLLTVTFFTFCIPVLAQVEDTLLLNNGNTIVGELKSMNRGVAVIETSYSDDDFKIEWEGITELFTTTYYLITLTDGRRLNGTIRSLVDGRVKITTDEEVIEVDHDDIVYMNSVDDTFISRMYAAVDLGYSFAKANNLSQFTLRGSVGYITERWRTDWSYDAVRSDQDEVGAIIRNEGNFGFTWFLPRDWYLLAKVNLLRSTELQLDLRTTAEFGPGHYFIHTNQSYWGIGGGLAVNNENFSSDAMDRTSMEAYLGTELNLFDIGDFSLLTNATVYPSITEGGRVRVNFRLDANYDLPLDFYIRFGYSLNYDNKPLEGASGTDYVIQTAFGWEL